MALNIPSTKNIKDRNVSNIESKINQDAPLQDKAYTRVISGVEALNQTELYKFGQERTKQTLALTATGQDLKDLGNEYETPIKVAESAVLEITIPGIDGTIAPATLNYIGDLNGLRYFPDSQSIVSGGIATLNVTAENVGTIGNLNTGDTLSLDTQIPGLENTATVISVVNTGADEEDQEIYRDRVLFVIRNPLGGSNAADYKRWSEEVAGVERAYPFAGKAFGDPSQAFPGDRTIYIQVNESVQADGIAPQSILDEVRISVNTDPITGQSRPALGLTDSTLYIESIRVSSFNVIISNLTISSDLIAEAKQSIEDGLIIYFKSVRSFVDGIDLQSEKNDIITRVSVSDIVQGVIEPLGGSADNVNFQIHPVETNLERYQMEAGEISKFNSVTYA